MQDVKSHLAAPETGSTHVRSEGNREHSWRRKKKQPNPFMSLNLFPHLTTSLQRDARRNHSSLFALIWMPSFWNFYTLLGGWGGSWGKVSCIPMWSWTCFVAEHDLKLLILLLLLPKCWYCRCAQYLVLCSAGNWTQGFLHARKTLYQLHYISRPLYFYNMHDMLVQGWQVVILSAPSSDKRGRCFLCVGD